MGNRILWLDALKGSAMLLVILGPLAVAYFFKRTRYLNFVFEPVKTLKQWGLLKN